MTSILFLIPTLDRGGAENVLVNLVNNMDQSKYQITVQTLFDKDSQKDRLRPGIEYRSFLYRQFHGNSRLQARLPAKLLYRLIVGKRYDIVVSYLEGPTAHILSGCPYEDTKKVAWFHVEMDRDRQLSAGFRSKEAALAAYRDYDRVVFVAESVKRSIERLAGQPFQHTHVLYNTVNTKEIRQKAKEDIPDALFSKDYCNIVSVGRIIPAKGYDRLVRIHKRLTEDGYPCRFFVLGEGSDRMELEQFLRENDLTETFTFLGFQNNPYRYVSKADLFVCSSRREGFSTAVSEALVLGVPVVSTNCSGAYELLGEADEYGIVTGNDEDSLYSGLKRLLADPELLAFYRNRAKERGRYFDTDHTVRAVEEMLLSLRNETA